ncbi:hypothetical protein RBI22_05290 [Alcaligenaceae bacterium C4P045]|nr:hypothetical protein [Alcaligenaceae bacterium C4P045]
MRTLLERPVSFRLSASAYHRYEASAAQLGMRLSQYLRFRLESDDNMSDQIAQLRLTLLDAGPALEEGQTVNPLLIEMLLLLRRFASPADVRTVHHELERQQLEPWSPD